MEHLWSIADACCGLFSDFSVILNDVRLTTTTRRAAGLKQLPKSARSGCGAP
jgi:hypothetical protein